MLSVGLTFDAAGHARAAAGLVGPNAAIQLAAALNAISETGAGGDTARGEGTAGAAERVFARARCLPQLRTPPAGMIDEAIPARLFEALWQEFPPEEAARIAHEAGRRTGAYVLMNRIPAFARLLLRTLPASLAAPLLLKAIARNAWTFAGSGTCRTFPGHPAVVTIADNPLAMPGGVWHVGVFEALFRALVSEGTRVGYATGREDGVPVCRFEIDWRASAADAA